METKRTEIERLEDRVSEARTHASSHVVERLEGQLAALRLEEAERMELDAVAVTRAFRAVRRAYETVVISRRHREIGKKLEAYRDELRGELLSIEEARKALEKLGLAGHNTVTRLRGVREDVYSELHRVLGAIRAKESEAA